MPEAGPVQELEDFLERLQFFQVDLKKLKTASVSRTGMRDEARKLNKMWLPLAGVLEGNPALSPAVLAETQKRFERLRDLAAGKNSKKQYIAITKPALAEIENQILSPLIKQSGLKTTPETLSVLIAGIPSPSADLKSYLDEALACARTNCFRAAVILGWCAAAYKIHQKLLGLGLPQLEGHLDKMRLDTRHPLFKSFSRTYVLKSSADIEEIPDAYLVLLCRFLGWFDDSQFKAMRVCLDLRNACAHPAQYQLDAIRLQVYFADLVQLVLGNPAF